MLKNEWLVFFKFFKAIILVFVLQTTTTFAEEENQCITDSNCTPKVRSRYPTTPTAGSSISSSGVDLCKCYANSALKPFDECEGEPDDTCLTAKCANSCEGFEVYCDDNEDGTCKLREIDVMGDAAKSELSGTPSKDGALVGEAPPPPPPNCTDDSLTLTTCPTSANITLGSITNETACLDACISCLGSGWGCKADFRIYIAKSRSNDTKGTAYRCACEEPMSSVEDDQACAKGSEMVELCVDVDFSGAAGDLVGSKLKAMAISVVLGFVSLWL